MKYEQALAHIRQDDAAPHFLEDHLRKVAKLSEMFAGRWDPNSAGWAYLAGLWHDLGKYSPAFQKMIRNANGHEAHLEDPETESGSNGRKRKVNHSSAGALYACQNLGEPGKLLAYLIAGHHGGLPDWSGGLDGRLDRTDSKREENQALYDAAFRSPFPVPADILLDTTQAGAMLKPPASESSFGAGLGLSLWLRMLFSGLVDADFLDTEGFMNPEKSSDRGVYPKLQELHECFTGHMAEKSAGADDSEVNHIRAQVLADCRGKATGKPGVYTLTVPTGGGKTLSSMAFALEHALYNNQERIIYVLPFTSILEQTADVFRKAFQAVGRECLIEHHSNMDPEQETAQSRLATENWDAPIILTTNVQFFESLFANRTSRCRKLHRIARSVVILDEAQQIPPQFKKPIEAVMKLLAEHYGVTFVLCTATQPALKLTTQKLPTPSEIASDPSALFRQLKRVEVEWPEDLNQRVTWEELAEELSEEESALCIVSSRKDATTLHGLMPQGTVHLSALMCAAHRSDVIAEIKRRLGAGEPVCVVSTQLVEAGVDIDFPVVYRALAGLDSIAQAAGRCNREGKLPQPGRVKVFVPPSEPPKGLLSKAMAVTQRLLQMSDQPLELTPENFTHYFEHLYSAVNSQDEKRILEMLKPDGGPHFRFKSAAEAFKLIEDEVYPESVIIPYDAKAEKLISELRHAGISRGRLRAVQRYVVNISSKTLNALRHIDAVEELQSGLYALKAESLCYDSVTGLRDPAEVPFDPASCTLV